MVSCDDFSFFSPPIFFNVCLPVFFHGVRLSHTELARASRFFFFGSYTRDTNRGRKNGWRREREHLHNKKREVKNNGGKRGECSDIGRYRKWVNTEPSFAPYMVAVFYFLYFFFVAGRGSRDALWNIFFFFFTERREGIERVRNTVRLEREILCGFLDRH